MKIALSTFLIIFFIGFPSYSQIQKGSKLLAGSLTLSATRGIGYNIVTEEEETYDYINSTLMPTFGVMTSDKVMLGSGLNISYSKFDYQQVSSFGVGPFARYFHQIKDKFYVFGTVSVGFGSINTKYNYSSAFTDLDSKTSYTAFAIGPGLNYFLKDNIAIEASFMINSQKNKDEAKSIGSNTLGIGLQFYF